MRWTARNALAACSGTAYREAHYAWPSGKDGPCLAMLADRYGFTTVMIGTGVAIQSQVFHGALV